MSETKKLGVLTFIWAAALALTVLFALETDNAPEARQRLELCAMSKGALCDVPGEQPPAVASPLSVADLGAMRVLARRIA
jgi:hypothetical protein